MTIHLAVDIGGTFTDLVALDDASGDVLVGKSSSRAQDPIGAVLDVVAKAGISVEDVSQFIHGTTVATNALLERRGTRVAFITNKGFRDVIFIQNANRRDLYSLDWKKPRPLSCRYDCLELDCRIDSSGSIVRALVNDEVEALIEHLRSENVDAVAISFLFSFLNPEHELQLAERLREALPSVSISLSHEVYPRWRENDRGHTTIADAYLKPMFSSYVENLERGLADAGSGARLLIMKSNGGVVEAEAAAERPVNYLMSGPVGGVMGATHFAEQAGFSRIMTIDIGGTSCDVSLIVDGEQRQAANFELAFGMPVKAPMVDIRTIGAGGGSIAWIDAGGLLRVGPQSAGSSPGPACYGQGGEAPTLTDANLALGRLNPANFCGGDIPLYPDLAARALEQLASRLDRDPVEVAHSIIELANHSMSDALNVISVEKGIDPRDFALVAFGGAGALHAAEIAAIIGMRELVIPPYPGNTSAYGLLTAGLRTDISATLLLRSDDPDRLRKLNDALGPLRERAAQTLRREGFTGIPRVDQRLEMRYLGQNYDREIPLATDTALDEAALTAADEAFHRDYKEFYGYAQPWEVIEIVGTTVTAIGERTGPEPRFRARLRNGPRRSARNMYFKDAGFVATAVAGRYDLQVGEDIEGPAVIEESLSTTLVPPGWVGQTHESGSLIITRRGGTGDCP